MCMFGWGGGVGECCWILGNAVWLIVGREGEGEEGEKRSEREGGREVE